MPLSPRRPVARSRRRACLNVEALESRVVPYAVSGSSWAHPQLVTISFVPDGTIIGANSNSYIKSNLFAVFNNRFGSATKWQDEILRGAQEWAQQANVNFAVVPDDGSTIGSGPDQQGDPNKGDIRISGCNFGGSALATADLPPQVNNYSVSGDVQINTAAAFGIGTGYDIASVLAHEIGHSLGLKESNVYQSVMYGTYTGVKSSLNSDDVQGIQAIYGARPADGVSNASVATATDLTAALNSTSLTAVQTGLGLATPSDVDYYTFTAPANTSSNLTVTVQSQGLSLLAPTLTLYDANQNQLGFASATKFGVTQYGTTLTLTLGNVTPGQRYYVKVAGADTSAFSTGVYALTLNLGTGANPTVPLPNTTTANGNPLSGGGGLAQNPGLIPWLLGFLLNLVVKDPLSTTPDPDEVAAARATNTSRTAATAQASGVTAAILPQSGVPVAPLPQAMPLLRLPGILGGLLAQPAAFPPGGAPLPAVPALTAGPALPFVAGTTPAAVAPPAAPSPRPGLADLLGGGGAIDQPGILEEGGAVPPTAAPAGPPPAPVDPTGPDQGEGDTGLPLDVEVRDFCFAEGCTTSAAAEVISHAEGANAPTLPAGPAVLAVLGACAFQRPDRLSEAKGRRAPPAKRRGLG